MNPLRLQLAAEAAGRLREALRDQMDEDDAQLWHDMVEGETELVELIEKALDAADEDEARATRIKQRRDQMAAREARLRARCQRTKALVAAAMQRAELRTLTLDEMTVSLRAPCVSVVVDNAELLTDAYWSEKVSRSPDKKFIKQMMDEGVEVPGAHLELGEPGVTVRRS